MSLLSTVYVHLRYVTSPLQNASHVIISLSTFSSSTVGAQRTDTSRNLYISSILIVCYSEIHLTNFDDVQAICNYIFNNCFHFISPFLFILFHRNCSLKKRTGMFCWFFLPGSSNDSSIAVKIIHV